MLTKLKALREEREEGFTLIELLVVILIIGILAAIAIPVFLNQRQTANDGAVQSDVKNAATQVESLLVSDPNAKFILASAAASGSQTFCTSNAATAPADCAGATNTTSVKVSSGVTLKVTAGSNNNAYTIKGQHSNGKQYTGAKSLDYVSASGGLQSTPGTW